MRQSIIVTIWLVMMVSACSSNAPTKTQYYLLNSPTNTSASTVINENQQNITVSLLELPDYLKQPSLVLQLSSHQLHYSHFHMWAEPLQNSFSQALLDDLNQQDNRFNYIDNSTTTSKASIEAITIKVTAFHATHQSQALLTGTFWVQNSNTVKQPQPHKFTLTLSLDKNGYEHAVEKMRQSINQLAQKIINNINVE